MEASGRLFDREKIRAALDKLAGQGIFIGTSSWKYPGWCGMLYDEQRYVYRGRFAESRFERGCLEEYAQVFKTVCVDAAYYRFPDPKWLVGMQGQVPADFQFTFKVSDEITARAFANLPRFGQRAGQINEHFLDAELFNSAFLGPMESVRNQVGMLIFEFSRFHASDWPTGRAFVDVLDGFLGRIGKGWRYGIEIRNKSFLHPDYFATLRRHGVAHVFNSWDAMPPIAEQMSMPGCFTSDEFSGARFLLKPGRKYQDAVDRFSPYADAKEPLPETRAAGSQLIQGALNGSQPGQRFIYVNNRLEGNALETIAAMIEGAGAF